MLARIELALSGRQPGFLPLKDSTIGTDGWNRTSLTHGLEDRGSTNDPRPQIGGPGDSRNLLFLLAREVHPHDASGP